VTSENTSQSNQSPPLSAASQAVVSIDAAGLVTRGDQLLTMRDVASARLFYERAAQAGDGQGALRMGMTFDPVFLDRSGFRSVRGDPAQAVSWYNRAAALGNSAAEELKTMLTKK
jgi:TPR repeat protein